MCIATSSFTQDCASRRILNTMKRKPTCRRRSKKVPNCVEYRDKLLSVFLRRCVNLSPSLCWGSNILQICYMCSRSHKLAVSLQVLTCITICTVYRNTENWQGICSGERTGSVPKLLNSFLRIWGLSETRRCYGAFLFFLLFNPNPEAFKKKVHNPIAGCHIGLPGDQ